MKIRYQINYLPEIWLICSFIIDGTSAIVYSFSMTEFDYWMTDDFKIEVGAGPDRKLKSKPTFEEKSTFERLIDQDTSSMFNKKITDNNGEYI